jgi:sulfate permease, SulP family
LANLPAINGLYTATLPSATYTFFGSSMQLAVGPVALVSLLQAELITTYGITPGSDEAVDFAGECAIAIGFILTMMSLFNLGDLIRFISHPVMSGFTTAAALLIGQNQLKGAFGFTVSPPQVGKDGYKWNYEIMQWFAENWNLNDATTKF